jgi:hypothetical protein
MRKSLRVQDQGVIVVVAFVAVRLQVRGDLGLQRRHEHPAGPLAGDLVEQGAPVYLVLHRLGADDLQHGCGLLPAARPGPAVDQARGYAAGVTRSTIHNFRSYLLSAPSSLLGQQCNDPLTAHLPVKVSKKGKKSAGVLKVTGSAKAVQGTKPLKDTDTYILKCLPRVGPCPTTTTTTTTPTTTTSTLPPPCPLRESPGLPYEITLTVPLADRTNPQTRGNGSDLDNGWTGTSHNFPIIGGSSLKYCLSGCDGTTTFACTGTGSTAAGGATDSLNGATFGAPLPLLAANVPVCVVNVYQDATLNGTFNLQTGEAGTAANPNLVHLNSMVYLRTTFPEVCPRCNVPGGGGIGSVGKCSDTAKNAGADCRVDGEVTVAGKGLYLLSSACTPLGDMAPTGLDIKLPFTTEAAPPIVGPLPCGDSAGPQTQDDACGSGSCNSPCAPGSAACVGTNAKGECIDAKGGISQLCWRAPRARPVSRPRAAAASLAPARRGTDGQTLVNAATFCIARTNSTLINITTGLPGPGAVLLPATVVVTRSP